MQNILIILILLLLLGSCKKEECPEIEPYQPYASTMKGQKGAGLRCKITHVASSTDQGCDGWFLNEVYSNSGAFVYPNFNMQIVEGLSDSIKQWDVYNESEFFVDFEFIGTGYECAYDEGLISWIEEPIPYPVELIKITKIEIAP